MTIEIGEIRQATSGIYSLSLCTEPQKARRLCVQCSSECIEASAVKIRRAL